MISGIVNVYKETGYTSHDVVARLRGIFAQKRIGHTGTLDPNAEGVLPVCLGKATKVCELITEKEKEYECILHLGKCTDTQDASGRLLRLRPVETNTAEVAAVIRSFIGSYDQIPPMYSALKVKGKKLYQLARQGIEIERQPRTVTIDDIRISKIELPEVTMTVSCSKGTYIRTLCHDIGERLCCGAYMSYLKRTKAAGFTIDKSFTIGQIEKMVQEKRMQQFLLPIDTIFQNKKKFYVNKEAEKGLYNGNRLFPNAFARQSFDLEEEETVCVYDHEKRFAGIYIWQNEKKELKPFKLFIEKD